VEVEAEHLQLVTIWYGAVVRDMGETVKSETLMVATRNIQSCYLEDKRFVPDEDEMEEVVQLELEMRKIDLSPLDKRNSHNSCYPTAVGFVADIVADVDNLISVVVLEPQLPTGFRIEAHTDCSWELAQEQRREEYRTVLSDAVECRQVLRVLVVKR